MRRRVVFVSLVLMVAALPRPARAQMRVSDLPARGALYVELFGGTAMNVCCSLNLELPVSDDVVFRAGTARAVSEVPYDSVLLTAQKLVGSRNHYLEIGGGLVWSTIVNPGTEIWRWGPTVNVGYRVYSNGWVRRYTFTPIISPFAQTLERGARVIPTFGFSIGRTF